VSDPGDDPRPVAVDEPPPWLSSWGRVYAAVLAYLALLILALYGFARAFNT